MRNSFPGFYGISDDSIGTVFTAESTIFIFDANILLTLYRCEEETRNHFFEVWENIKDKCWFPHQVCLEYQRNRLKVVKDSRDALDKIPKKVKGAISELKTQVFDGEHNQTISRYSNLKGEISALFDQIDLIVCDFSDNHINARKDNIDYLNNHDVIRDKIDELTESRIGSAPLNQGVIEDLNKSGKTRYKYNTGPGFADSVDKKTNFYSFDGINYDAEYGDYYVWSQILEYVKDNQGSNVVYVSNDAKSDFYYKIDGKIRGPNESLRTEIKNHGAAEFLLQNIDTFLHHANTHLNARIDEYVITELTNASFTDEDENLTSRNGIIFDLSEENKSLLSSRQSAESIYSVYNDYFNQLNSCNMELKKINSIPTSELKKFKNFGLKARAQSLQIKIRHLENILHSVGSEIAFLQESEAINQLRENE